MHSNPAYANESEEDDTFSDDEDGSGDGAAAYSDAIESAPHHSAGRTSLFMQKHMTGQIGATDEKPAPHAPAGSAGEQTQRRPGSVPTVVERVPGTQNVPAAEGQSAGDASRPLSLFMQLQARKQAK
jgi:hypothetical protein